MERTGTCTKCGLRFRVPPDLRGTRARCSKCGGVVEIPPLAVVIPVEDFDPSSDAIGEVEPPTPSTEPPLASLPSMPRPRRIVPPTSRFDGARGVAGTSAAASPRPDAPKPAERTPAKKRPAAVHRPAEPPRATRKAAPVSFPPASKPRRRNRLGVLGSLAALALLGFVGVTEGPNWVRRAGRADSPAPASGTRALAAMAPPDASVEIAFGPRGSMPDPTPVAADEVDLAAIPDLEEEPATSAELADEIRIAVRTFLDPESGPKGKQARRSLEDLGKPALPQLLNALKRLDYTQEEGATRGYAIHRLLESIARGKDFEYRRRSDAEAARWNARVAARWIDLYREVRDDPAAWERLKDSSGAGAPGRESLPKR